MEASVRTEVHAFLEQVEQQYEPALTVIRNHPFVQGVAQGTVSLAILRQFAHAEYWYMRGGVKHFALSIMAAPDLETQRFYHQRLSGELEYLKRFRPLSAGPRACGRGPRPLLPCPAYVECGQFSLPSLRRGEPGGQSDRLVCSGTSLCGDVSGHARGLRTALPAPGSRATLLRYPPRSQCPLCGRDRNDHRPLCPERSRSHPPPAGCRGHGGV